VKYKSVVFCEHANECPTSICVCPKDCACRMRMCKVKKPTPSSKPTPKWVRPTRKHDEWGCTSASCNYRKPVVVVVEDGYARCAACAEIDGIEVQPARKARKPKPAGNVTTWSGWACQYRNGRVHFEKSKEMARRHCATFAAKLYRVRNAPMEEVR